MWKPFNEGKVRNMFVSEDGSKIKLVASDRVSAFDKVLKVTIPGKGKILTQISKIMFDVTEGIIPNAWLKDQENDCVYNEIIMVNLNMLPVECIVRGYMFGSLWKAYKDGAREFCGITIPDGLKEGDKLPEPIFTPTTKADVGQHDEEITFDQMADLLMDCGYPEGYADTVKNVSILLYETCSEYCLTRGYILADTKFEFGADDEQILYLADEVCTPDSSRFWLESAYIHGRIESADKQYIRDFIAKEREAGREVYELPQEVIDETVRRYNLIFGALYSDCEI